MRAIRKDLNVVKLSYNQEKKKRKNKKVHSIAIWVN